MTNSSIIYHRVLISICVFHDTCQQQYISWIRINCTLSHDIFQNISTSPYLMIHFSICVFQSVYWQKFISLYRSAATWQPSLSHGIYRHHWSRDMYQQQLMSLYTKAACYKIIRVSRSSSQYACQYQLISCMSTSGNSINIMSVGWSRVYPTPVFSHIGQQPLYSLRVSASLNVLYMSVSDELMNMSAPAYLAYISASVFLVYTHY